MNRVAVIGGGVAGLCAATAFARRGAEVTVHEQAPAITEVGAGIQISPNGAAVLTAMGLGDGLAARSLKARAVRLIDGPSGRSVLTLDLARHAPDLGWHFIHRADLIGLLQGAAEDAGARIVTGARIDPGHAPDAARIVAADGIRSAFRTALLGPAQPRFTGQVAWRAILDDDLVAPEVQVWMGPGRHLVSYPLPGGRRNIVAVEERRAWADEGWHHEDDPLTLRRVFEGFARPVRDWLDRIETPHLWGLFDHPVAPRWSDGHTVLIGDAAHPMLPFLAQGANMALEDGWALAHADSLEAFEAARRPRAARVVRASRANARNYHLSNPLIRTLAHQGLRLGGKLAPAQAVARFDWLYRHDVTRDL